MKEKLLTIVMSTFNRSELLEKNLSTMISYGLDEIEFIVGDNASTDNTWEILQKYDFSNVTLFHNGKNVGIDNFILLAFNVKTPFFLFLNDRDYIRERELKELLVFLKEHPDCEMIASVEAGRLFKEGYHYSTDFAVYYNRAEHPGEIVYKTEFLQKNIDYDILKKDMNEKNISERSCYIRIQLQYNLKVGYYRSINYIVQPENRDKVVPQVRKEMYGVSYILPGFQIPDFNALIEFSQNYSDKNKIAAILLARYKISLLKLELEFYNSVGSSNFRNRNHCENVKQSEWFKNGLEYTKAVINNGLVKQYDIKNNIKKIFVKDTLINFCRIMREKMLRIFSLKKKYE